MLTLLLALFGLGTQSATPAPTATPTTQSPGQICVKTPTRMYCSA
jgi:hypothetical protein